MDIFSSIYSTSTTSVEIGPLLACVGVSLVLGLVLGLLFCVRHRHTASFVVTLAILPAIVCVVIAVVNGNVGAGVAVAGAFSLVRFRSVPGSARDIGFVFLAMCVGLVLGMGYIAVAVVVTLAVGGVYLLYQVVGLGKKSSGLYRSVHVTIPEDLDYTIVFDDVFARYTTDCDLISVRTSSMGSLFKLVYDVHMAPGVSEKAFIDELRCRNANLEISLTHRKDATYEL